MQLPGTPAAVAIFHPFQFFLAGALLARHPARELWYGRPEARAGSPTLEQLHAAASTRAALTADACRSCSTVAPLRMAELGIAQRPAERHPRR